MLKLNDAKPFLRWAGGKRWLTNSFLSDILPKDFNNYFEPFLGGGAVFFYLKRNNLIKGHSFISDLNNELIDTYLSIQNDIENVKSGLSLLENSPEEYYKIRSQIPNDKVNQAIRFIYLNQTSYNGLYRVNRNGVYNVPYGYRKGEVINYQNLDNANKFLTDKVDIFNCDFEQILPKIKKGDLVFLDPPYTVAHENNGFVEYNQSIFKWEDQIRISKLLNQITEKEAFFILTNAKHDSIHDLFYDFGKEIILERPSVIGGKGSSRQVVKEYIYTNY